MQRTSDWLKTDKLLWIKNTQNTSILKPKLILKTCTVPLRHWFTARTYCSTHRFLCDDDAPQKLVLQPLHGDGEIDDGSPGGDLGGVGRVGQLGGDVQPEAFHHIALFVSNLDLEGGAGLDVVLLEDVVEGWVQFFVDVLNHQGATLTQGVLQVGSKVLVVQVGQLQSNMSK